jgi:hypothetical protein
MSNGAERRTPTKEEAREVCREICGFGVVG